MATTRAPGSSTEAGKQPERAAPSAVSQARAPAALGASGMLALQAAVGNRAVTGLLRAPSSSMGEASSPVVQRMPVVQRRLKATVLTSRGVFDRLSVVLESRDGVSVHRDSPTTWTLSPPVPAWEVRLTNNGVGNETVDAVNRVLTIDFDNANIPDLAGGGVDTQSELDFEQAATERIDSLIAQHVMNTPMNGVFLAGSVDNDPTHVNHVDRMKLRRLDAVAELYISAHNTLNEALIAAGGVGAAPPAVIAARGRATIALTRLEAQIRGMQLATPAKLAALHGQTAVDLDAARVRIIDAIARHQEFQAFEAQHGALGHAGAITHEAVDHLRVPEARASVESFRAMGIGGGHVEALYQSFIAASGGRYRVELVQQRQVTFAAPASLVGQRLTLRLYRQYMKNPDSGAWVQSNVKKSTADNLNLFLYAAKAGLVGWLGAGNAMPGDNQSFGRFSGNAQPPVSHAATGIDLGGYGTRGAISGQNEIKTLFVSDEWFYDHMATDLTQHLAGQPNVPEITAAFQAQPAPRRAAILLGLTQQAMPRAAGAALPQYFVAVSGLASRATQALKSNKASVRGGKITVTLGPLRAASAAVANQYQIFTEAPQPITKNVEKRLYDLKATVKEVETRLTDQWRVLDALIAFNHANP